MKVLSWNYGKSMNTIVMDIHKVRQTLFQSILKRRKNIIGIDIYNMLVYIYCTKIEKYIAI